MKNLFTFLLVTLICVPGMFAQDEGDSVFVAEWTAPVATWWPKPATEVPARAQATAIEVASFDAEGCDFDAEWAKIPGNGNAIASQLGLNESHKGADDFKDAAFKVFCDAGAIYILMQYTDDDVTGNESVEIAWAPYLKIDARREIAGLEGAWYTRYVEFGGYKATFKSTGFDAAMMVTGATGAVNWGGTNDILTANLFMDDHTAVGSSTIKRIYTIGYPALTGEARPDFDLGIWNTLNDGKGISLDMKVNDVDADDALNTDPTPVAKPAEYWWNTTTNDCWAITYFAGFLDVERIPGSADAEFVAGWTVPVATWWPKPTTEEPARSQASTIPVTSFDPVGCDFDAEWAKITNENVIDNQLGLNASHKGADDFKDAGFKVFCDESAMYILLRYTDDDVTGNETVEIAWSPYFKIEAPDLAGLEGAWYTRYVEFGGYKATYKSTGFDAAMMVTGATGAVNWGGTNDILATSLYMDDHTAVGSSTIKQIFTIGYPALTGEARPEFNQTIWNGLNDGKGISLDMKVNDVDADDALNTDPTPVAKPAEYWWNTTTNDCWAITYFAGFLNIADVTGISHAKTVESIFKVVTPDQIHFSTNANVAIYNMLGQQLMSKKNIRQIDLTELSNGIYIVRANNESRKIIR